MAIPTQEEWEAAKRAFETIRDDLSRLVAKYCSPDPKDVEIDRLRTVIVTIKINAMRDGFTPALEAYINEQLDK